MTCIYVLTCKAGVSQSLHSTVCFCKQENNHVSLRKPMGPQGKLCCRFAI